MSREAMQMALEALENAGEAVYARGGIAAVGSLNIAAKALRQALKTKYEQARSLTDELMDCVDRLGSEADTVDPRVWQHLLVYAPQKQEPVAWANSFDLKNFDMKVRTCPDLHHTVPLYTALPKRTWVGLTDEEIAKVISGQFAEQNYWVKITRAIEAKLKEKNT